MFESVKSLDLNAALGVLSTGTCVKECPQADKTPIDCFLTARMKGNPSFTGCNFNIGLDYLQKWGIDTAKYTEKFGTASNALSYPFRYSTQKMIGFCVPRVDPESVGALSEKALETFKKLFQETILNSKATEYLADLATTWKLLAIASGTAVVLAYLYLFFVRCFGACLVWGSIVII